MQDTFAQYVVRMDSQHREYVVTDTNIHVYIFFLHLLKQCVHPENGAFGVMSIGQYQGAVDARVWWLVPYAHQSIHQNVDLLRF